MKQKLLLLLVALLPIVVNADVKVDGIYYYIQKSTAIVKSNPTGYYSGDIIIPSTITYHKKTYSVTRINDMAFAYCRNLISVTIPKSVTSIGDYAFKNCRKLECVNGFNTSISLGKNIFAGCLYKEEFYYDKSFAFFSHQYILPRIEEWQKKRDFETTAQFKARVTKENQQKKVESLMQEAIKEYTNKYPLKVELGNYDADYELYILNCNYGKKYLKVPLSEAPDFRANFKNAVFSATYFPTKEVPQIDGMTVELNDKIYYAEMAVRDITATTINMDLPEIEIPLDNKPQQNTVQQLEQKNIDHSIDQNIPMGITGNNNTFAVIIGNEKYTQVAHVPYAANDAKIFAEYCKKTLGLPKKNIRQYENATFGTILTAVGDVRNIAQAYNGNINVIFYYAGHGIPNETSRDAFLLPVDANGQQTEACYPVSRLYKELGELGAQNVIVFMDACFSGSQRGDGMLALARGVAIKAKADAPQGNMVVFSAATGDETAYPYNEKGHGMFTYFLLKKLQDTKGDCTLGELGDYIQTNVRQQSVVINQKIQSPTIVPSQSLANSWQTMKLK